MKDNFDFDKVGTRLPYQVPEGFFDSLTQKTMQNVEEQNRRRAKTLKLRRYIVSSISIAAISVLALLLFVDSDSQNQITLSSGSQTTTLSKYDEVIDKALESVSDSEMDELAAVAENDLFYIDNIF